MLTASTEPFMYWNHCCALTIGESHKEDIHIHDNITGERCCKLNVNLKQTQQFALGLPGVTVGMPVLQSQQS